MRVRVGSSRIASQLTRSDGYFLEAVTLMQQQQGSPTPCLRQLDTCLFARHQHRGRPGIGPAARDCVSDAFVHLKAIAADAGAQALLEISGVKNDLGIEDAADRACLMSVRGTQRDRHRARFKVTVVDVPSQLFGQAPEQGKPPTVIAAHGLQTWRRWLFG